MIWARDGRPGGMGRFTAQLGAELEEAYKQALVRSRRCDTLIAVVEKDAQDGRTRSGEARGGMTETM
jgi:hypothetical protein